MSRKIRQSFKKSLLLARSFLFHFAGLFTFFLRQKNIERNKIKSILVIAQKRMGDAVVSIPAFRALRRGFPHSRIVVLANTYIRDILESVDAIDDIIEFSPGFSFYKKIKKIRTFSDSPYDMAVDLTCDYTVEGAFLCFFSRAAFRVGYDTYGRGFLFHTSVPHDEFKIPISDEILVLVKSLGVDTSGLDSSITPSGEAQKEVQLFLDKNGIAEDDFLVGIHPGGHYSTQRWFPERFAKLGDELAANSRIKIVLMGGPQETGLIETITQTMSTPPLLFTCQPVRNLLALLHSCCLLICNNSGPLHLAAALKTPTVSMMGPTLPERWWPQGEGHVVLRKNLDCMPCNDGVCERGSVECLDLISVSDVVEAANTQIEKWCQNQ